MGFYKSTDTLCGVMNELFTRAIDTPTAAKVLRRGRMVIRLVMSDPPLTLTIDGKSNPPRFVCHEVPAAADLTLHMPADVLHNVWLGKVRLRDAFFTGQIKLEGSRLRALTLADLFREVEALYPHVLRERGLL
jgi:putative sterol carrier protein